MTQEAAQEREAEIAKDVQAWLTAACTETLAEKRARIEQERRDCIEAQKQEREDAAKTNREKLQRKHDEEEGALQGLCQTAADQEAALSATETAIKDKRAEVNRLKRKLGIRIRPVKPTPTAATGNEGGGEEGGQ